MLFKHALIMALGTIVLCASATAQSVAQEFQHLPAASDSIKNHVRKEIDVAIRTTWLKYAHAEYLKIVGQIPLLVADHHKIFAWYGSLKFSSSDTDFKKFVADKLYQESLAFEKKVISFSNEASHFQNEVACDERTEFDKMQLFKLGCLYLPISPGKCFLPLSDDEAFATSSAACHKEYGLIRGIVQYPDVTPFLEFLTYSMRFEAERLRSEQVPMSAASSDGEAETLASLKSFVEMIHAGGECEKYTSAVRGMIAEAGVLVSQSATDPAQAELHDLLAEKLRDLLALSTAQPDYLDCGTPPGNQP